MAVSEHPEMGSWENFCQSKLSPLSAQAVLRVTNISREGIVIGSWHRLIEHVQVLVLLPTFTTYMSFSEHSLYLLCFGLPHQFLLSFVHTVSIEMFCIAVEARSWARNLWYLSSIYIYFLLSASSPSHGCTDQIWLRGLVTCSQLVHCFSFGFVLEMPSSKFGSTNSLLSKVPNFWLALLQLGTVHYSNPKPYTVAYMG